MKNGYGMVYLLYAIERKYPNAMYEWGGNVVNQGGKGVRSPVDF